MYPLDPYFQASGESDRPPVRGPLPRAAPPPTCLHRVREQPDCTAGPAVLAAAAVLQGTHSSFLALAYAYSLTVHYTLYTIHPMQLCRPHASELIPSLMPGLYRGGKPHWNQTVTKMSAMYTKMSAVYTLLR
jgi:hypothetical protein